MVNPSEMKAAIAGVFDRSAASYEQVGPVFFAPMGAELAARAELRPGERVLDLGCGRGHVLLAAARAVGPSGAVTGLDLASGMVAAAADDAVRLGLDNVEARVGDAADPDVPPGSYDVVTAGLLIFFLPDPAAALRSWARALKPGGRLAITTFGVEDARFHEVMKTVAGFLDPAARRRPFDHESLRTAESIAELLADTGFTRASSEYVTFETRFADTAQWWDWIWSHGGRALLEQLPADRLAPAEAAARQTMEAARTDEGDLAITTQVRFTTAALAHG